MSGGQIFSIIIIMALLIAAVFVGNTLLTSLLRMPLERIPFMLKFLVHGVSFFAIGYFAKKLFKI